MSEKFTAVTVASTAATADALCGSVSNSGVELVSEHGNHYVEDAVSVYLMRDPEGSTDWVLDPTTVSGEALDSTLERPEHGNCECGQPSECELAAEQMTSASLPNGTELLVMLAAALGYELHPIS